MAGEAPVETETAAPERSEERVEEEAADVGAPFHSVRAGGEGHALDVMIGVVVAALRQICRAANGHEARNDQFRRAVVERRDASVGHSITTEFFGHIDIAVFIQEVNPEA